MCYEYELLFLKCMKLDPIPNKCKKEFYAWHSCFNKHNFLYTY